MNSAISQPARRFGRMSMPAALLRAEGLAVLAAALAVYAHQGFGWLPFVVLLLAPDLAILAYAIRPALGRLGYNLAHTYVFPVALAAASLLWSWPLGLQLALIWLAHIGMDRTVGYGLKYADSFKHTHLDEV